MRNALPGLVVALAAAVAVPVAAQDSPPPLPAAASAASTPAGPQLRLVPALGPATRATRSRPAQRSAYLLVYFKDETHSLYFATSRDGYTFTDVNGGRPVLSGRDIADQHGIRDPHVMRGPDGAFYLAMTDLNINGQRDGWRATQWERPRERYSWGNNRNMILMKSRDLLHWTHAKVSISALFPAFAEAGCAWAPETIYDPKAKRMMVYFTTRIGAGPNFMAWSYADDAFTTLTTAPKQILHYPDPKVNTIDADITHVGGKYRMFYVAHQKPGSIREAVSDRINEGYAADRRKVDPETTSAEAPNLWRRFGTGTWVLMYDVFGARPGNMGFAETTDFRTFRNVGRFNDPGSPMKTTNFSGPKHGAVMAITPGEADRLNAYFGER